MKVQVKLPPKLIPVFTGAARYKGAYGGRGSGKTFSFAKMSAVYGYMYGNQGKTGVILCGREFMNSLEESSLEEVKKAIRSEPFLNDYYEIGDKYIKSKDGLIKYAFAGLRRHLDSIKSKAQILIAWIDEADTVSEKAWLKLIPTVREDGSEIWVTWNPELEDSATRARFQLAPPEDSKIVELNWRDNPWFPAVLEKERIRDKKNRPDIYGHVWEGELLTRTDAQIFAGKFEIKEFEPKFNWTAYYGLDFGFANDPTAAVECYVYNNDLYINREAGKVGLDIDDTYSYLNERIPGIGKRKVKADSARPETINFLKRNGMPYIRGVKKWAGSVEDGIEHIKSYNKVYIHPRCTETAKEYRLYSYKVDPYSGEIQNKIIDAHNHYIDAIRYALAPLITNQAMPIILRL